MTGRHWAAVGAFLVSIAGIIGGQTHWSDMTSPVFVGALVANLGSFLIALFSDKPERGGGE